MFASVLPFRPIPSIATLRIALLVDVHNPAALTARLSSFHDFGGGRSGARIFM